MTSTRFYGKRLRSFAVLSLILLAAGCSDPYEASLPPDEMLTTGEAQQIASTLQETDRQLFLRWADRAARKESYPGEPVIRNPRMALIHQREYESYVAKRHAAERAAVVEEQKKAEVIAQKKLQRDLVDQAIKKQLAIAFNGYNLNPVFNRYGYESHREWQFSVKVRNRSKHKFLAASGWVTFTDVFGEHLGAFPVRIEVGVGPNKTDDISITKVYDIKSPSERKMATVKQMAMNWFFESAVFEGQTINIENLLANEAANNSSEMTGAPSSPLSM